MKLYSFILWIVFSVFALPVFAVDPAPAIDNIKTKRPITLKEQQNADFFTALKLINSGRHIRAEENLQKILSRNTNYHLARAELASLWRKQGKIKNATELLQQGLHLNPNYPRYLETMALIYQQQREPEKVLSCLLQMPMHVKNSKRYLAFLAATYYQSGLYELARKNYGKLIQLDSNNSKWWLGLAIVLDTKGEKDEALKIFNRTSAMGGLNASVIKYVNKRIAELS